MATSSTSILFPLSSRLWGLITTAGVVAAAATVLGFFGTYHWLLDLCAHFRVQYFLGLSVASLLLLIPRKRRRAAIFGALAAVNLGVILPLYVGRVAAPTLTGQPVRAMLANVNTRSGNPARVADAIRRFDPDILVLEEVNAKWLSDLGPVLVRYAYATQEPRDDNFGIALFSRFPLSHAQVVYLGVVRVPSIVAEIATPQGTCTVLATHPVPPAGAELSRWRNAQLAALPGWVHRATSPLILLGDLNMTPWSPYFRRLLRDSGLHDSSQGRGVRPTWPTFNPFLLIPLDHCLYASGIAIIDRQTGPNVGSDHYPVIVDFVIR
jgi:endonuclease/exonuclease/phosphatase (EEP) superfamily protein YafD